MKDTWRSLCAATILAACLFCTAHSYTITVDAHAEECFFESVEADTKMGEFHVLGIFSFDFFNELASPQPLTEICVRYFTCCYLPSSQIAT